MNTKKRAVIGRKVTTTNLDELITKNSGNNIVERSPISERDIEWERVEIESQDVLNKCRKSIYNKRSFKDLSLYSSRVFFEISLIFEGSKFEELHNDSNKCTKCFSGL